MNRKKLMNKINKNINLLERKIQYQKLYNFRNIILKNILNLGITLDFSIPFIMSLIIIANTKFVNTKELINFEEIISHNNIETIDTSDGSHLENVNSNIYDKNFIECSTVFKNEFNDYVRKNIIYEINGEIDHEDIKNILSLNSDELINLLNELNIKSKTNLEKSTYTDEYIMVVNHINTNATYKKVKLTNNNINNILRIIVIFISMLWIYKKIQKSLLKMKIKDILCESKTYFNPITDEELELIKELLESQKKNLNLLTDESNNLDINNDIPVLRRRKL